ncbi:MAG: Aldo/keto reductase [Chloroflexi bacterium]|jgi:diketogulonate reductase-like aldo/keto reductase|nr:MAG: Aldo/keto reductase [Chloroflexota bacterium]
MSESQPLPSVGSAQIPALGLGTAGLTDDVARTLVREALAMGYRHLDTAAFYKNEGPVGQGIADAALPRDEIFLTTKVWFDQFHSDEVRASAEASIARLGVDYVDLLLLHWPNPDIPLEETLRGLNAVAEAGLTKHIGVSNFSPAWMANAVRLSERPIVCNQVEYHARLNQDAVLATSRELAIPIVAYSPLAQGALVDDPLLTEIGVRHDKTASQVALRWLVQQPGVCAIPRTSKVERAKANAAVFDFRLSDEEMSAVAGLARPDGRRINPERMAALWG